MLGSPAVLGPLHSCRRGLTSRSSRWLAVKCKKSIAVVLRGGGDGLIARSWASAALVSVRYRTVQRAFGISSEGLDAVLCRTR